MLEKGVPAQQANISVLWFETGQDHVPLEQGLVPNSRVHPRAESEGGFPESIFLFGAAFHPHLDPEGPSKPCRAQSWEHASLTLVPSSLAAQTAPHLSFA